MLKLNASYSKKVPAETEYSSQSYHASIEVEIPDGLSVEQLEARIHETFDLVRSSVEVELHENTPANDGGFASYNASKTPSQGGYTRDKKTDGPASAKQISYLLNLARSAGITPAQIAGRFQVRSVNDLTRNQCSQAIDELSGKAA